MDSVRGLGAGWRLGTALHPFFGASRGQRHGPGGQGGLGARGAGVEEFVIIIPRGEDVRMSLFGGLLLFCGSVAILGICGYSGYLWIFWVSVDILGVWGVVVSDLGDLEVQKGVGGRSM